MPKDAFGREPSDPLYGHTIKCKSCGDKFATRREALNHFKSKHGSDPSLAYNPQPKS